MILITGATGTIGRWAVRQLHDRAVPFEVLARDPAKAAGMGAAVRVGNFEKLESLFHAFEGIDRVLLNGPPGPAMVEAQKKVIDLARGAGVKQIVRVSSAGADPKSDRAISAWHGAVDAHLEASGLAWTSLQPSYFMQNLFQNLRTLRAEGKIHGAWGQGKIGMIDAEDIAASGTAGLTGPIESKGRVVLTGGEAIDFDQVAETLSRVLGRPIAYVNHPPEVAAETMQKQGIPPAMAQSLSRMMAMFAQGGGARVTDGVRQLTGRAPRTFEQFARDNAAVFRGDA